MNKTALAPGWLTRRRLFHLLLVGLGLLGTAMIVYATRWGAALSDDSYYYIKPARDLLAGQPYALSPHYPPGLPFLLLPLGWLGLDPQPGLRFLNAFCFGLNIFLAGRLVRRISGSERVGLGAALLVLLAQPLIEVHAWAMSEAVFIALVLGALSCLGEYLDSWAAAQADPPPAPSRSGRGKEIWRELEALSASNSLQTSAGGLGWLAAGAVLAGAAGMVRYAGVALIAAGAAGLLLLPAGRSLLRRALDAAGFGLLAGLLYGLYPLLSARASSEISGFSSLRLGLPTSGSLTDLFYNTLLWALPGRLARGREAMIFAGLCAALLGLAGLFALFNRAGFKAAWARARRQPRLALLLLFAAASFAALYQANQSEVYRSPFDFRLLAPTHLALLLAIVSLLGLGWRQSGRLARIVLLAGFIGLAGLYASRAAETLQLYHEKGMGFASAYWAESDIVSYLRQLPPGQVIVTTAPMGVYFASARESSLFTAYTPEQLAQYLKANDGILVYIHSMPFSLYGQDEQAYLAKLRLSGEYSDSAVYRAP